MGSDCSKCDRSRAYPKETVPFLCTHIFPTGAQLRFKDNEYMIRKRGSWYFVGICKNFKSKSNTKSEPFQLYGLTKKMN